VHRQNVAELPAKLDSCIRPTRLLLSRFRSRSPKRHGDLSRRKRPSNSDVGRMHRVELGAQLGDVLPVTTRLHQFVLGIS